MLYLQTVQGPPQIHPSKTLSFLLLKTAQSHQSPPATFGTQTAHGHQGQPLSPSAEGQQKLHPLKSQSTWLQIWGVRQAIQKLCLSNLCPQYYAKPSDSSDSDFVAFCF